MRYDERESMRSTSPRPPSRPILLALVCADGRALAILPGSLLAIGIAAALGWVDGRHRLLLPAVLAGLAVAAASSLSGGPGSTEGPGLSSASHWVTPALLLIGVAHALSVAGIRRASGSRGYGLPLGLGMLACIALTWFKGHGPVWPLAGVAAPGVVSAFFWFRPGAAGAAVLAAVVAAIGIGTGFAGQADLLREDARPPVAAVAGRNNLVLIVLDTVRADHLSSYGYRHETTPRIDGFFGERGIRYDSARAASSWTLPSHASLFTGWLPSEHGAEVMGSDAPALAAEAETIAEALQAQDYQTAAVVSNLAYFSPRIGLDRGFAHFDNRPAGSLEGYVPLCRLLRPDARIGSSVYRRAERITDSAVDWLDGRTDAPFFLFVNYMDAHDPLMPPSSDRFGEEVAGEGRDAVFSNLRLYYDRSLFYLDEHVGRLLDEVEARGLLETTAIVLTGDHGEGLGDRDFRGHGRHLHDELIRVPLLVKAAGEATPGVDPTPTGFRELHAELFRLVGLPAPGLEASPIISEWRYLRGEGSEKRRRLERRLGRRLDRDLIVWLEGDRKVIAGSDGSVRAFDLGTDPGELEPLDLPDEAQALARERALAWFATHPLRERQAQDGRSTADELRALENLGYTD